MATVRTRWLLSILLVNLPNSFHLAVSQDPPAAPSPPDCFIPCDERNCEVDIYCIWDPRQEPQIPTNYSLHWEPANSEEENVFTGTKSSWFIDRKLFASHDELRVWVQAKNQHGSARSQDVVFNTENIIKPPPPKVTSSHHGVLEIYWNSTCDRLQLSVGLCNVRHRAEADQVWIEEVDGIYGSYTFDSLLPCTAYEFQVRCACGTGLTSDWSAIHRTQGIETAPVGQLDVWRDCGIFPASRDCVLTWKRLPLTQACGLILGYEVRLSYNNGSAVSVNVSTESVQLECDELLCKFTSSLKDAPSVSVSAYNIHGATVASSLAVPLPGEEKNSLQLRMSEENLTVSWDLPAQLSDNLKEYVVQYKQAGCSPGQAFDWVKVNKGQTKAVFKGQFKEYKPYQVSLFTVSHRSQVHHLSSLIGYSLQRTPARMTSFTVLSLGTTHVTLLWKPIPLSKREGVIRYYQIGLGGQKVYTVNVSPQHENATFELQQLSPGQDYKVWIRAVTEAGPGENTTMKFKTKHHETFAYLPVFFGVIFLFVISIPLVLFCGCHRESKEHPLVPLWCWDRVPDPHNSRIFREMKHQVNDPMAWTCIPIDEPHPKISVLEVVEKISNVDGLPKPEAGDGSSQMESLDDQGEDVVSEECHRTDPKYGREAYSKMVDSDDERERGDCWSLSEEEECTSGYEKHFMPTASDILEVS